MGKRDAKSELFELLDQGAFQPVLSVSEDDVPEERRNQLMHVKLATVIERERFETYDSVEELYQMYQNDLSSGALQTINKDLRDLRLPILADFQQQVERTAQELGIHR